MENIILILKEMVKKTPNDMELGKKIRKMVLEIKNQKNGIINFHFCRVQILSPLVGLVCQF